MTVAELIEHLEQFPKDAKVVLEKPSLGTYYEITEVCFGQNMLEVEIL